MSAYAVSRLNTLAPLSFPGGITSYLSVLTDSSLESQNKCFGAAYNNHPVSDYPKGIIFQQENKLQTFEKINCIKNPPTSLDFSNFSGPVHIQGACGACYAFSATQVVQTKWNMISKRENPSLSVMEPVLCQASSPNKDDWGNYSKGCSGQMPENVLHYIQERNFTINDVFPYTAFFEASPNTVPDCITKTYDRSESSTGWCNEESVTIDQWFQLAIGSNEELMCALDQYGPLSILIDDANIKNYESGIITECVQPNVERLNHAVLLVGYDTTCNHWKIKNSWGQSWGEGGYFRLKMTETNMSWGCIGELNHIIGVNKVMHSLKEQLDPDCELLCDWNYQNGSSPPYSCKNPPLNISDSLRFNTCIRYCHASNCTHNYCDGT